MRYNKQPISISDQIDILKKRGLIFNDELKAKNILENISYFRLAGYWRTMEQDSSRHIFCAGSHFEDVVDRYNFDSELKTLIFAAIQQIEISVRTRIIHFFSLAHGAFWFLDDTLAEDEDLFNENLSYLRTELSRSHDEFIAEHFRKYDEPDMPPAWKTFEVASFGTLSKLYKNMNDNVVKKQVARSFNIPQHKCLQSWLATLTIVRNTCAHHARLWNAHFSMVPRTNERMRGKWIYSSFFFRQALSKSLLHRLLAQQYQPSEHLRSGFQISSDEICQCATFHDGLPPWMGRRTAVAINTHKKIIIISIFLQIFKIRSINYQ